MWHQTSRLGEAFLRDGLMSLCAVPCTVLHPKVCEHTGNLPDGKVFHIGDAKSLEPALDILRARVQPKRPAFVTRRDMRPYLAAGAGGRLALAGACLVVSKSPGQGQYDSVQKAINALSTRSEASQCVFISRGEYVHNVRIDERMTQLSIFCENVNSDSQAAKSLSDNLVTLKANNTAGGGGSGDEIPALGCYGCQFTGGRRALIARAGHQLYAECLVRGDKDIISGDQATAWFERIHISHSNADPGYVTGIAVPPFALWLIASAVVRQPGRVFPLGLGANGRQSTKDRSIFVFNACSIASGPGAVTKPGRYYLGRRPKGAFAQVVFQKTDMSDAISPKGWAVWRQGDARTEHVVFGEYRNTGPGAKGTSARFSRWLNESITMTSILGKGYDKVGYYDGLFVSRSLVFSPSPLGPSCVLCMTARI
ncbi:pectinesterase [Colletotrichum salicis]|uniref:pectinesterase n=1 Tax=Colletotrichum salicis TaxID=1209931 RepID=A0A135S7X2_9PEZI|nr:pectinesterase [Colletotrichum salicis]